MTSSTTWPRRRVEEVLSDTGRAEGRRYDDRRTANACLHTEELAEDALRAIRTLRGMLDDDDPRLAREARRLLRELDVRGVDE